MSINFADIQFWWDGFAGRKVTGTDYTKLYDLSNTTDPTFATNNPAFIKNGDVVYAGVDGTKVMPVATAPSQGTIMFWGDITRNTTDPVFVFSSNAGDPDNVEIKINTDGTVSVLGRGGVKTSAVLEWQNNGDLERWFFTLQYTASAIKCWRGNIVGNLELIIDTINVQADDTPDNFLVGTNSVSGGQTNVKCAFVLLTTQIVSAQTVEDVYVGNIPIAKIKGTPEYAGEYFQKATVGDDAGTLETLDEHVAEFTRLRDLNLYNSVTAGYIGGAFKTGKIYSIKSGTDLVFTRNSEASTILQDGTLSNVAIDVPVINFRDGAFAGYYSQVEATNLLLHSEAFDNAYWTSVRLDISEDNPINGLSFYSITQESGLVSAGFIGRIINESGTRSFSVFAKANGKNYLVIRTNLEPNRSTWFNLSTGMIETTNVAHTAKIEDMGNGVFRCSVVDASATHDRSFYYLADVDGSFTVVDNSLGILITGAQLETGSTATSYIKTVATTVTRDEDVATITNVADKLGLTAGSCQITALFPTDYPLIINGLQATVTGIKTIRFEYTTTTIELYVDNVLADSATGTYDWSDLNEIQLGHYNGTDQPNFELRDLIVRKA